MIAKMEEGGKGVAIAGFGPLVERLEMNLTNPSPDLDADTRATRKAPHPFLTDINVRKALSMAIDRVLLTEIGYGKAGFPTCDLAPDLYAAKNDHCLTQDIAGANALLEVLAGKRVATVSVPRMVSVFQSCTRPPPTPSVRTSRR